MKIGYVRKEKQDFVREFLGTFPLGRPKKRSRDSIMADLRAIYFEDGMRRLRILSNDGLELWDSTDWFRYIHCIVKE
jgi:hypothetical protein